MNIGISKLKIAAALLCLAPMIASPLRAQPIPATKRPIKVGAISSLSIFPDATAAARAYFDAVNAAGGIYGRKLQLVVEDDKADPKLAALAARKLVETEDVVANVGSASALECSVNAAYYAQMNLVSVPGTGVDPVCFDSPNISPVNAGPFLNVVLALKFLREVRKRDRICLLTLSFAPIPEFERMVTDWIRKSGHPLTYLSFRQETPGNVVPRDIDSVMKAVAAARCEGMVFGGIEAGVIAWIKAANAAGVKDVDWVFLPPAFTAHVASALADERQNIFAMSDFEPWSSRSGMLTDWRNVMQASSVPLTGFSQGGYVAATVVVQVLRGIKGEITRESVTRAFKTMAPRPIPLMGTPYSFGPGARHNPNRANMPVQLQGGKWVIAHWEYITIPSMPDQ
jgi:branched-chain amino acid transport system substrate-binding protein